MPFSFTFSKFELIPTWDIRSDRNKSDPFLEVSKRYIISSSKGFGVCIRTSKWLPVTMPRWWCSAWFCCYKVSMLHSLSSNQPDAKLIPGKLANEEVPTAKVIVVGKFHKFLMGMCWFAPVGTSPCSSPLQNAYLHTQHISAAWTLLYTVQA